MVDGWVINNFEYLIIDGCYQVCVDGCVLDVLWCIYLMFNKLCGLVMIVQDEQGCDMVYCCFDGVGLLWIVLVGCLDKVSEGLLLFSNDLQWVVWFIDLMIGLDKIYYVQIDMIFDVVQLQVLCVGVEDDGECLCVWCVDLLCSGEKIVWLEVVLEEGCNCYICCLLVVVDINVLWLVCVVIGQLLMGELGKGVWCEFS